MIQDKRNQPVDISDKLADVKDSRVVTDLDKPQAGGLDFDDLGDVEGNTNKAVDQGDRDTALADVQEDEEMEEEEEAQLTDPKDGQVQLQQQQDKGEDDNTETEVKDLGISCLKSFIKIYEKRGVAYTHLANLVTTVYPSYKLHFLSSLVRKHRQNKQILKGKPAKPRGLQVIYFKQMKKSGVAKESIVQFFASRKI